MHAGSRLCSHFSIRLHQKWHSQLVWAKNIQHEAKHTPSKEKLLFSLSWNVLVSGAYNETFRCFSMLIQLDNPSPVSPVESPDVYIVERLFSSSLVVVVSLSMPRRMNVYHFKKGTEICNYSYSNNILSVRLNRQVRTGRSSGSGGVAPAYTYLRFLFFLSLSLRSD